MLFYSEKAALEKAIRGLAMQISGLGEKIDICLAGCYDIHIRLQLQSGKIVLEEKVWKKEK